MNSELDMPGYRRDPWPEALKALQDIWASSACQNPKEESPWEQANRFWVNHAWKCIAARTEQGKWGPSVPDAEDVVAEARQDALFHTTEFWQPDDRTDPYWRSALPGWSLSLHSLHRYLWHRIDRVVENLERQHSNSKTLSLASLAHSDPDGDAPESWDAVSLQVHETGDGRQPGLQPDEALFLKDRWDTFLKCVEQRSFQDKRLIVQVAEMIAWKGVWEPRLLAQAVQCPIPKINKIKQVSLRSVLAAMRADAFIESLPVDWQRLVRQLYSSVGTGTSLDKAVAEYADANKISSDEIRAVLNQIAKRKEDWSRRTHKHHVPLEVF